MIVIDDAGWDCLIGGVVIGCYRVESGAFAAGQIAPQFFQNDGPEQPDLYRRKAYLAQAAAVSAVCLQQLAATVAEPVQIGRSHGLDGVRVWLTSQGYRWQTARTPALHLPVCVPGFAGYASVTGLLSELVKRELQARLAEYGYAVSYQQLADRRQAGRFWYQQVEWLKGGHAAARQPVPERAAVCKTGWDAYARWAYQPYSQARAQRAAANRRRPARTTW